MKVRELEISGLKLVELDVFGDARGFFVERYNLSKFEQLGLPTNLVQDNHSHSRPRVIRGLHYQYNPPQGKFVGVTSGKIWDVVVDLRPKSATFLKYLAVELSSENGKLLWIPSGFAHGFCVIGDSPADVVYKVDSPYNSKGETGLCWNDPELRIPWPIKDPILSDRDRTLPTLENLRKTVLSNALDLTLC